MQISEPIDFQFIERCVNTGGYQTAEQFDRDLLRLCQNNLRYYGHNSAEGTAALKIRKTYNAIKQEYHSALLEILESGAATAAGKEGGGGGEEEDPAAAASALPAAAAAAASAAARCFERRSEPDSPAEDDVIRCPCSQFRDEGLMVQCEKCLVWQHGDCVGLPPEGEGGLADDEKYLCERCGDKESKLDIELRPQPEYASPGETYYTSLLRDDLQLCVGDTVYVLRAFNKCKGGSDHEEEEEEKEDATEKAQATKENEVEDKEGARATDPMEVVEEKSKEKEAEKESVEKEKVEETAEEKTEEGGEREDGSKAVETPHDGQNVETPMEVDDSVPSPTPGHAPALTSTQPASPNGGKKKEVTVGGIQHKLMSPTKGPSLEASSLAKGNYPTYRTVEPGATAVDDMDIFRVERLWRTESGQRFAFGHHYLRPRETYHEPSRRFYRNEVFRVPIYEVLPLDSVWGKCWVLDPTTFCRGRPVGAVEEHVYICEYRVDKGAR